MVRGLVEEQRLRMPEQGLREEHAHLLAALELGHLAVVQGVGDVQALEQDGGVAFGRVPVLFAHDALELAEAHAVLVGHGGLGIEELAFLEGLPQPVVAHHDRVDHAELIERELVLPEDAELLGLADRALLGRQLAGQQLHERGLAGAVRARQAVPAACRKCHGNVIEEHLRAVPHGHTLDCDHSGYLN